jgi:trigger factor
MDIQITTKKSEGVERLLEVSVPVETVRDAEEQAARRYASKVRLPGFRPGKAPAAMVRKRFSEQIRQETLEALVQEAYRTVLEKEKLQPIAQPHVHDLHFHEGEPLKFELHFEVRPELALSRIGGFKVTRPADAVSDEQVTEQLDALRDQRASWNPVSEKPLPGDQVTVLLSTADENGDIPEGKEYRLVLGGGQAIAGIEELIMEAAPGETVERPVKWPEDFPDEAQRGQTKKTRVTLNEVKRKASPDLDDAFAREVGDFETLDALKAAVRTDLAENAKREADAAVRQQLVEQIIEANPFDVPQAWVRQLMDAYAQMYQIPEKDREQFAGEFKSMAERQVRRDLVIDTIAERENLKASESDIDDRVAETATKRGANPSEIYAALQKAGRIPEIERSITEEKVFEWLMAKNTVQGA